MAARKHRENHDVEQTKKMASFITRETTFGQHDNKFVFGFIDIFDLDMGFQIDPVEQPINRDSAGSRNASLRRTCALNDHLDTASLSSKMYNCALP